MNDRSEEISDREETFEIPWWLGGDQMCPVCHQRYALELEIRCSGCDGPLCEHCAVTVRETSQMYCYDCLQDAEDS